MTKQQLIDELRKQGYGRIADMLDAESPKVEPVKAAPVAPVEEPKSFFKGTPEKRRF